MTSERDFDRKARAWLDLGPDEAPDRAIASVLQAVETIRQDRRRLGWPDWRPITMNRLVMLAVVGGLVAIAIGALALGAGKAPEPTSSAPPAAIVSPDPADSTAPSATPVPGPIPQEILGTWIAELRTLQGVDQAATSMIMFNDSSADPQAPGYSQEAAYSIPRDQSTVNAIGPDIIRIVAKGPDSGPTRCARGDVGLYRWSIPADGWLTLELVQDEHPVLAAPEITTQEACSDRGSILPGTWQRTTSRGGDGGPTVIAAFEPFITVTLPPGSYSGDGNSFPDTTAMFRSDGRFAFSAWKDPDGFADPCDIATGRTDLDPGIDPFIEYLTTRPGLAVTTQESMVDGRRAVVATIATDGVAAPCWDDGRILLWTPHASRVIDEYSMPIGETETVLVTEVNGATFLIEALDVDTSSDPVTVSINQEVVDSIRFLDTLPTAP
jgi:hypothetical protein